MISAYQRKNNGNIELPIGTIIPWHKSITGAPTIPWGWAECDGSTVSDAESKYNGAALPSLNATNRFLRGNSTSGTCGGASTHTHNWTPNCIKTSTLGVDTNSACGCTYTSAATSSEPSYMNVVFIMRIK